MHWLYPPVENPFGGFFAPRPPAHPIIEALWFGVILAPLWEEAVFRHFPLQIMKSLSEEKRKVLLWPTILFSSFIFGYMHDGASTVPIQGVGGIFICILYVKTGYKYWWGVAYHAFWNLSCMTIFPLLHW
jgi:membrane protease YdiL (CAAX protease family)